VSRISQFAGAGKLRARKRDRREAVPLMFSESLCADASHLRRAAAVTSYFSMSREMTMSRTLVVPS
jgi:hypothetical protein